MKSRSSQPQEREAISLIQRNGAPSVAISLGPNLVERSPQPVASSKTDGD